jgi:predicted nucleotidyltransferase
MSTEFGLPEKSLACIRAIFAAQPKVSQVLIYGSRAQGNYKTGSDIDLTLLGDGLEYRDLLHIAGELDDAPIPYTVDLSIFERIDNPNLVEHIQRVGKSFYQRAQPGEGVADSGQPPF